MGFYVLTLRLELLHGKIDPRAKKPIVLLAKRTDIFRTDLALLHGHVCIGNLRKGSKPEDDDQERNEASYPKIYPLHVLQALLCIDGACKEYTGCEKRSDERAHGLDALGQIEANLTVAWRSANGEEGISARLERRQSCACICASDQ